MRWSFSGSSVDGCILTLDSAFPPSHSQTTSSQTTDKLRDGEAKTIRLSQGADGAQYGATADTRSPQSCDDKLMDGSRGCHNRGYQEDEDCLE